MMSRHLTVYIRHGCHLCTEMTQALERLRPELGIRLRNRRYRRRAGTAGAL